jgi:hypothetical protein
MNNETVGYVLSKIIEYIAAGTLFVLAISYLFFSIYPPLMTFALELLKNGIATLGSAVLVVIFFVLLYPIGVVYESISRMAFEWRLKSIKRKREREKKLKLSHGQMRIAVQGTNNSLYDEIASQISRMRVDRALLLTLLISLLSSSIMFVRAITGINDIFVSVFVLVLNVGLVLLAMAELNLRFSSYCRAIERAYDIIQPPKKLKHE